MCVIVRCTGTAHTHTHTQPITFDCSLVCVYDCVFHGLKSIDLLTETRELNIIIIMMYIAKICMLNLHMHAQIQYYNG